MRFRSFLSMLALVAAMGLPLAWSAPAAAESGAHRNPPPPIDTPITIADAD